MRRTALINRFKHVTFKNRIMVMFLFSSLIPFISLGVVSLYTIDSILGNKVENAIESKLKQDVLTMENTLNNLNHISQQLAFGEGTNRMIEQLRQEKEPYERVRLLNEIKSELNVLSFSNPNVGLILYYYPESGTYDFENFRVRGTFQPFRLPIMAEYPEITYYGPHLSFNSSMNQMVFSTMRKVNLPDQNVYLYIETGFNSMKNLLEPEVDKEEMASKQDTRRLLILDNDRKIVFSQDRQNFPEQSRFQDGGAEVVSGTHGPYLWKKVTSNQGWSLVSIVPKTELNRERDQWLVQITGFFLFFFLAALAGAWLLWKMVYRPLDKFNTEIKSLIQSSSKDHTDLTHIPEFDYLLYQIRNMKGKIWELYGEIEQKEQRKADLEVEKLLYQINPHFLMNTLNTAHWLAAMNGQEELDRLLLSLNKLLHYNLGKMGEATTIGAEIDALKEYMQLQQIRYDFEFDVDIDVEEKAMSMTIPRFILQPLVENALYHGVSDDGYIHVDIKLRDMLEITIEDNGAGMPEEKLHALLEEDARVFEKVGMGIGMKYVKRVLQATYGREAIFQIKSELGKGTVISLRLPLAMVDHPKMLRPNEE